MKTRVPFLSFVLVTGLVLLGAACGGDSESESASPSFVVQGAQSAGTADIPTTTVAADTGAGGAAQGEDPDPGPTTTSTLPQNEQTQEENIDDLFTAMRTFNSCLEDEGQSFIGPPSEDLPADDPRMAQSYIDALTKCAAVSQIQDALATAQTFLGSDGKTPEEIEEQNRGLVRFTDCLKGRGWDPAPLQPDDNGQLQIGDLGAPDGENLFESDDLDECRRLAQEEGEG